MFLKKIFWKIIRNIANQSIDQYFGTTVSSIIHNNFILRNHNNKYTFPKNQICFIHVPKTGGTSIKKLLKGNPRYYIRENHDPVSKICKPSDGYMYTTVIRDPVNRAYSYYMLNLRDKKQPYHFASKRGLENFIKYCWEMRNIYTKYYSGNIKNEVNELSLNLALKNIKMFHKIIKFEDIDQSIDYLFEENINIQKIPHENKSEYKQMTLEERAIIETNNLLDIKLYNNL